MFKSHNVFVCFMDCLSNCLDTLFHECHSWWVELKVPVSGYDTEKAWYLDIRNQNDFAFLSAKNKSYPISIKFYPQQMKTYETVNEFIHTLSDLIQKFLNTWWFFIKHDWTFIGFVFIYISFDSTKKASTVQAIVMAWQWNFSPNPYEWHEDSPVSK